MVATNAKQPASDTKAAEERPVPDERRGRRDIQHPQARVGPDPAWISVGWPPHSLLNPYSADLQRLADRRSRNIRGSAPAALTLVVWPYSLRRWGSVFESVLQGGFRIPLELSPGTADLERALERAPFNTPGSSTGTRSSKTGRASSRLTTSAISAAVPSVAGLPGSTWEGFRGAGRIATFTFGSFELDSERRELRLYGVAHPLQPKVLELLIHLARARERVVSHEELFAHLWPGTRVSDAALYRLVKEARAAVHDDGRTQAVVRTFPRKGFRFVAAVERIDSNGERRLDELPAATRRGLAWAALLGDEFELRVLAQMLDVDPDRLLAELGPAAHTGFVSPDEREAGRLRFANPDARREAEAALSPSERLEVHRRAAEVYSSRRGSGAPAALTAAARHATAAAVGGGDVAVAVEAGLAAARDAASRDEFGRAVDHYEATLRVLAREGAGGAAGAHDVWLERVALHRRAGAVEPARAAAFQAAAAARTAAMPAGLARAAVAVPGLLMHGQVDREWVELAEEALAALPPTQTPTLLRGELLNRLAYHLYWSRDAGRSRACNLEARSIAEELGERGLLAWVCMIDRMLTTPEGEPGHRIALAREAIEHARAAGDPDTELYAREQAVNDAMEAADVETALAEAAGIAALAERSKPLFAVRVPTMLALHHGDFTAAERFISDAELGDAPGNPRPAQYRAPQLMWLRLLQGRLGELVPLLRVFVNRSGELPAWRAALALGEWEAGNPDEARREFESLAARDWVDLPQDFLTSTAHVLLAELCARLGAELRAVRLYERIKPGAGRMLVLPRASIVFGPADLYLGLLAALAGEREAASGHLEAALVLAESTGSRPVQARVHAEFAAFHSAEATPTARLRAREHAERGGEIARALGMRPLADRCREVLEANTG